MKSVYPNSFRQAIAAALFITLAACNLPQTPVLQSPAEEKASATLVALLFVKQDNLKNEFRGEIYPNKNKQLNRVFEGAGYGC